MVSDALTVRGAFRRDGKAAGAGNVVRQRLGGTWEKSGGLRLAAGLRDRGVSVWFWTSVWDGIFVIRVVQCGIE